MMALKMICELIGLALFLSGFFAVCLAFAN